MARGGARLMLTSRNAKACAILAAEIGGHSTSMHCDVTDYAAVEAAVAATIQRFGQLDVLVNNAGTIQPIERIDKSDPTGWADSLRVNLVGPYHGVHAAVPALKASRGIVINVSSGAGEVPFEGWSHYCVAKAATAMLTRCVDLEPRDAGIRCFGIQPGIADTEMQVEIRASGINPVSQRPRSDLPPPSEAGDFIAWVAKDTPDDLIGAEFNIDDQVLRQRAGLPTL
jgi:NAD(P)-dependent dehydrogenase (short-subunit alcohol dehydrogenase family)